MIIYALRHIAVAALIAGAVSLFAWLHENYPEQMLAVALWGGVACVLILASHSIIASFDRDAKRRSVE